MNWYTGALKKYLDFSGRAQRMEYWMFTLINFLIMLGLSIVDAVIGLGFLPPSTPWPSSSRVSQSPCAAFTIRVAAAGGCSSAWYRSSASSC